MLNENLEKRRVLQNAEQRMGEALHHSGRYNLRFQKIARKAACR